MCPLQQPSRQITADASPVRMPRHVPRHRVVHAGVALLLCYALYHTHPVWTPWLAMLRELHHDDGAPARDIGRAVSLARSLRDRHAMNAHGWLAILRPVLHDLLHRAAALPRDGFGTRLVRLLVPLLPLTALLGWLH